MGDIYKFKSKVRFSLKSSPLNRLGLKSINKRGLSWYFLTIDQCPNCFPPPQQLFS